MKLFVQILLLVSVLHSIEGGSFKPVDDKDMDKIKKFCGSGYNLKFYFVDIAKLGCVVIAATDIVSSSLDLSPLKNFGMCMGLLSMGGAPLALRSFRNLSSGLDHFITSDNYQNTLARIKQEKMPSAVKVSFPELDTLYKAQAVGVHPDLCDRIKKLGAYKTKMIEPLAKKLMEGNEMKGQERTGLPPEIVDHIFEYAYKTKFTVTLDDILPLQKTFWYAQPPTYESVKLIEYKSEDERTVHEIQNPELNQMLTLTYPLFYDPKTGY